MPAIGPDLVEAMRARLRSSGRERDAVLLVLLAYAGLRPGEALALEWRHVRERTLVIEQAVADGQLKSLKNRRRPRAVRLLAPLREDLDRWHRDGATAVISRRDGAFWRGTDWRSPRSSATTPPSASTSTGTR